MVSTMKWMAFSTWALEANDAYNRIQGTRSLSHGLAGDDSYSNASGINTLNAIAKAPVKTKLNVDSGAATTAWNNQLVADYPSTRCPSSGTAFGTAGGGSVTHEGQVDVLLRQGGSLRVLRGGKFDVPRNLLSVSDLCKQGHKVCFQLDDNGADLSYIEHVLTGERTSMVFNGVTWDMECEVIPYEQAKETIETTERLSALGGDRARRPARAAVHGGPAPTPQPRRP